MKNVAEFLRELMTRRRAAIYTSSNVYTNLESVQNSIM